MGCDEKRDVRRSATDHCPSRHAEAKILIDPSLTSCWSADERAERSGAGGNAPRRWWVDPVTLGRRTGATVALDPCPEEVDEDRAKPRAFTTDEGQYSDRFDLTCARSCPGPDEDAVLRMMNNRSERSVAWCHRTEPACEHRDDPRLTA